MDELVTINQENNTPITSSLLVAEKFGKEHAKVIRSIENILGQAKNGESSLMFEKTTYVNTQNKEQPMYLMTRDGFTLLAMGFTGQKALQFKLDYIGAFNKMEEYIRNQSVSRIPKSFSEALMLAAKQQEEIEQQQKQIAEQNAQIHQMTNAITDMQAKVSYVDKVLACKSTVKITVIAQDYGMSAKAFNLELHNLGIQHKVGSQWILYAKFLNLGYVQSKSFSFTRKDGTMDVNYNTEWTQKGRLFLYEELKRNNVLPLIEQE